MCYGVDSQRLCVLLQTVGVVHVKKVLEVGRGDLFGVGMARCIV